MGDDETYSGRCPSCNRQIPASAIRPTTGPLGTIGGYGPIEIVPPGLERADCPNPQCGANLVREQANPLADWQVDGVAQC